MARHHTYASSGRAEPREVTQALKLIGSGLVDDAESCLRRFLRRQPKHIMGTIAYAHVLTLTGRPLQAIEKLDALLRVFPNHDELLLARARAWHEAGDDDESQDDLLAVADNRNAHPANQAEACYLLGRQLLDSQELGEAIQWLEAACEVMIRPVDEYWLYLGIARMRSGAWQQAIEAFEQGLEIAPESTDLHLGLAETCRLSGNSTRAREEYETVLKNEANQPRAVAGLAQLALGSDDVDEAARILEEVMTSATPHPDITTIYVRVCRRQKRYDEAMACLRKALTSKTLSALQKAQLWADLGTLYEQHEHDYEQAFSCFRRSNAGFGFGPLDPGLESARVDAILEAFTADAVVRLQHATVAGGERMVFIVGIPRSGTSLIEQIIASHPQAFGAGELDRLNHAAVVLSQQDEELLRPFPDYIEDLTTDRLNEAATTYLDHVSAMLPETGRDAIRIITDKMPHNYHYVGLIPMLFPGAKVIHCRRHPLDTCLSCYATPLNPALRYTTSLIGLSHVYRQYHRLMQHWHEVADALGVPILDVQYETLVNDIETGSRDLIKFCGLDWDDRCLRFHETSRTVSTASTEQVRTPLYTSSVGRYEHYRTQLAQLADDLADLID